ncbi:PREDICTED: cellular tumor antigen p53 [Drosophila arizonae]|uniref:Cellular tumor antigen p53 n=1 Tax=Drosophila arizonae TaxID=7263 RepID=A0ABM1Q5X3_DROAR|nr:PREDICTED: cellular tumor antigen p53 [Drosophila arizonae]
MSRQRKRPIAYVVEELDTFDAAGSSSQENISIGNAVDDIPMEPMAFLQGLNSGNLMQFSQESILREMMLQNIKTQINSLPKLENHNNEDYNFSMVLEEPPKSHWMYSEPLNKLYIRMNKTFNIDATFKIKMPIQPLNLRAFLCFVKDVSGPVLRCQNHMSTDPIKDDPSKRESLLRCENPNATYCGTAEGKSIGERYSVLVPLNMSRPSQHSGGLVRQTFVFSFSCQNSCFGRKETCLVFCLENNNGDILGQHVLLLKICTCPKRDRNMDERQLEKNKIKSLSAASEDDEVDGPDSKRKYRRTMTQDIKEEVESNDSLDMPYVPADWQVSRTLDGDYRLVIKCEQKDMLLQSIEGIIEKAAVASLRNPQSPKLRQHVNNLLNLKKCAQKLP